MDNVENQQPTVETPAPEAPKADEQIKCETCNSLLVSPQMVREAGQSLMGRIPAGRNMVDRLTGVQAKLVLKKIIESPLEDTLPQFTTQEAALCFQVALAVQSAKFFLFLASRNNVDDLEKEVTEALAKQEAEKVSENNNVELNEGVSNGS